MKAQQRKPLTKMKRQPSEWEKIFAYYICDKRLTSKYTKNSYNLITKK